jgi:hypothetical protein
MPSQYSVTVRNAQLDALETAVGTAPKLRFYSGAMPANCGTAASGTLLSEASLPSDWMAAASAGAKAKAGTWTGTGAAAASTGTNIGYARILDTAGTNVHWQGNVTVTGGGGAMTVDNVSIADTQPWTVTTFTITAGNA